MYTPIIASTVTLASSLHGAGDTDPGRSHVRHAVQAMAGVTGLVGFGFHAGTLASARAAIPGRTCSTARRSVPPWR